MILHIVPSINEEASGPSYSVVKLCKSIYKQYDLKLAVLNPSKKIIDYDFVHDFPCDSFIPKLGRSPQMHNWISSLATKNKIKILHNHSIWMMPNIYPSSVSIKYNIPLVTSPRGTLSKFAFNSGSKFKKIFWHLKQKKALEATSCFHATALSEYNDIKNFDFKQPVSIIPNGVDIPTLKYKQRKSNHRTLLFLGRIHPTKGLDLLLPAWQKLQKIYPDWKLIIAGPDNYGHLNKMLQLAEKLRLQRVDFIGPVYGEEKLKQYQQADLFILPTYSENFGMSVAESLACATPTIVTKGAPWEGLLHHRCGWWTHIDVDAIFTSLQEAMGKSSGELHQMGINGRSWMINEFSWTTIAQMMIDTYNWISNSTTKPNWIKD